MNPCRTILKVSDASVTPQQREDIGHPLLLPSQSVQGFVSSDTGMPQERGRHREEMPERYLPDQNIGRIRDVFRKKIQYRAIDAIDKPLFDRDADKSR